MAASSIGSNRRLIEQGLSLSPAVGGGSLARSRRVWLAAALAATALTAVLATRTPASADHTAVVVAWGLGMGALLLSATEPVRLSRSVSWRPSRWGATPTSRARTTAVAAAVVVGGLAVRLVRLDEYPWIADGDGMGFALLARAVAEGRLRDPFNVGYLSHPTLFAYVQQLGFTFAGDGLVGARLTSALIGTAAVGVTYLLGRRLWTPRVGLIAAALLAALPLHLHFSRVALNNVVDSLAIVTVLLLIEVAFVERRSAAAVAAGIVLGLAQYGYFGARILLLIVAVVVAGEIAGSGRAGVRAAARQSVWMIAGLVTAALPLGLHYLAEPADLDPRAEQVSIFAGWFDAEQERTGRDGIAIVADQLVDGALLPLADRHPGGHYRPQGPLVGRGGAVALILGAIAMVASIRRRERSASIVAVSLLLITLGVASTIGVHPHRWVIATPLVMLVAAVGIDAVGRVVTDRWRSPHASALVTAATVVAVGALVTAGLAAHFRRANELSVHGDLNSAVATALGYELQTEPPGTTVYTFFGPRMFFASHATVPFLAPHVTGVDVQTIASPSQVPQPAGRSVFVFLPERLAELDHVTARLGSGSIDEVHVYGHHLYTTFRPAGGPEDRVADDVASGEVP